MRYIAVFMAATMLYSVLAGLYLLLPWWWFLLIIGVLLLEFLFAVKPEWGLYFLIFSVPLVGNRIGFTYRELWNPRMNVVPLFLFLLAGNILLVAMLKAAKIRRPSTLRNPLRVPIIIFLYYSMLTIFWTPDVWSSVTEFVFFSSNIVLFFFIVSMITQEDIHRNCVYWFLASTVVASVLTIFAILVHPNIQIEERVWGPWLFNVFWDPKVRIRGYAIEQPNFTSLELNLGISAVIGMFFAIKATPRKFLLGLFLGLFWFSNCLTTSKGGLGAMLFMGYFFLAAYFSLRKRFFTHLCVLMVAFILMWIISMKFVSLAGEALRSDILAQSTSDSVSIQTRLQMWKEGFQAIARTQRELTGLGLGGFQYYTQRSWAHNLWFSFYFDFGVVGLGFLCGTLLIIGKLCYAMKRIFVQQTTYFQNMSIAFCGGLIAIGVHSVVDFYHSLSMLWVYLALMIATLNLTRREYREIPAAREVLRSGIQREE